jgi:hypothetical protein
MSSQTAVAEGPARDFLNPSRAAASPRTALISTFAWFSRQAFVWAIATNQHIRLVY